MTRTERLLVGVCGIVILLNTIWLSILTRYANEVIPARTMFRSSEAAEEIVLGSTRSNRVALSASESGTALLSIRGGEDGIVISCGDSQDDPVIVMSRGRSGLVIGFDADGTPQITGTDASGEVTLRLR